MRQIITSLGRYMASPFAFLILFGYGALWFLYKPETFEWHAGATLATWFMTLVIQRAEHRDTQAIHAKLDEMLHVMGEARNELTRVDEEDPTSTLAPRCRKGPSTPTARYREVPQI